MKNETKQRISKSLKSFHNSKKVIRDAKKIAVFIAAVMIVSFFIGKPALAPMNARHHTSGFPSASERQMSVAEQIRTIAKEANRGEWADYLVKLAYCESNLNPSATNGVGNYPEGSVDRGLFQYNSYWQSKVSDECAFDVECATRTTIEFVEAGNQNLWVCDKIVKGTPIELIVK